MEKTFAPSEHEEVLYSFWEKQGLLKSSEGKPFTILMPPPNANASLHAGHGMYTVDDIIIRYKRLRGYASLWIPGADHAGIETQFVYEKHLAKQGKSRMDFDRETLYNDIAAFVKENSGLIFTQFKKLGFLADWERSVFTLDEHVLQRVFDTFQKMEKEGYVYRGEYMVNYCTHCGTSLAELEIEHVERKDPLYYIKYGPFTLATVRPETKFGDTAVAVHPQDKRYKPWIGKEIEVEGLLGKFKLKVIGDDFVDPKFGTGVVKVTPGHDPNDYEMGKRHNLEMKTVIDWNGRLTDLAGPYKGMKVKAAREKVAEDLQKKGLMEKIDQEYTHAVSVCYKCKHDLEPMIMPNWFLKVNELKKKVIEVVKQDSVKFYPKKGKKLMLDWLTIMHDWPISRQIVWGIRIPVWYKVNPKAVNLHVWWIDTKGQQKRGSVNEFLKQGTTLSEIEAGLQKVYAKTGEKAPEYVVSQKKPGKDFLPETDTFDTWFSSGQWPLVTLHENEYSIRYPTDLMGTLVDILKFWVSRMIMFSLYIRNEIPFKHVYLWPMVTDAKGLKMSKSKGNVVNPTDLVKTYGADAFRACLFFEVSESGKVNLSDAKLIAMRNFTNKIWNIGRFINMTESNEKTTGSDSKIITALQKELTDLKKKYLIYMESYKLSYALGELYEFIWHRLADYYIEQLKVDLRNGNIKAQEVLRDVYLETLKMLHPFMPFVTEAIWQIFQGKDTSILKSHL